MMKLFIHSFNKIALCIIALVTFSGFTEEKAGELDLFLLTGYGIPIGGYFVDSSEIYENVTDLTPKETEDHYLNYGHGLKINAGVNYNISNYLCMRFGFNYTFGLPSIKVKYKKGDEEYTEKYKRSLFGVNIMLTPRFEAFGLLDMYAGVGIGISFAFVKIESTQDDSNEGEIRTSPGLTFNGLMGTDFRLNDKFTVFGELSFNQMSFKTQSRKYTDSVEQDDFNKDSNTSSHLIKIPGSNFGLCLGIRLKILHLEKTPEVF